MIELFDGEGRNVATFLYKHWAPGSEKKRDHVSGVVKDVGTRKILGDCSLRQNPLRKDLCTALAALKERGEKARHLEHWQTILLRGDCPL